MVFFITLVFLSAGRSFLLKDNYFHIQATAASGNLAVVKNDHPVSVPQLKLSNPPEIVKAVYVTGYSAGSNKYLDYLDSLFKNTEINAVVVDIKDSRGNVSYASGVEDVIKYNLFDVACLIEIFDKFLLIDYKMT